MEQSINLQKKDLLGGAKGGGAKTKPKSGMKKQEKAHSAQEAKIVSEYSDGNTQPG